MCKAPVKSSPTNQHPVTQPTVSQHSRKRQTYFVISLFCIKLKLQNMFAEQNYRVVSIGCNISLVLLTVFALLAISIFNDIAILCSNTFVMKKNSK